MNVCQNVTQPKPTSQSNLADDRIYRVRLIEGTLLDTLVYRYHRVYTVHCSTMLRTVIYSSAS